MRFLDIAGNLKKFLTGGKQSLFNLNVVDASTRFNNYALDKHKLAAILSNPALLKLFSLQCDTFSLGKVYVYQKDTELESDPFLNLINHPNPMQSGSQFLWDWMFWNMLGNDYCYVDSSIVEKKGNRMYHLEPYKIKWPYDMQANADKFIFSDDTLKEYSKKQITYCYNDGTTFKFPLDRLVITHDLTNGVGNFFKGPSRLDALYKVISNSEHSLDAKNINVRFSGKFLVGSNNEAGKMGLGEIEKLDIQEKFGDDNRKIYPLKTMVQIRRFVEDMGALKLDEAYLADYFLMGSMFNIPRDVLEANVSSTFENQEKARMSHISYTLQPKGNDLMNAFERHFGYDKEGKNIVIDWMHLPFTQVFEKEKAEVEKTKIASLKELLAMGVPIDDANAYLDLDFTIPPPEKTASDNSDPATLEAQAALRGSVGGVQGILAIQSSVSAGTTSFEAALSILTIVYGFTEQDASDLLGKPTTQQTL